MKTTLRPISLVCLLFAMSVPLAACGQSGDGSPDPNPGPDGVVGPPTITQAAAGQGQDATVDTAVASLLMIVLLSFWRGPTLPPSR